MSEGQDQEKRQLQSIASSVDSKSAKTELKGDSTTSRIYNKRPRAGALVLRVYEEPRGKVNPGNFLLQVITKLLEELQIDKDKSSSAEGARELYQAAEFAVGTGLSRTFDDHLIRQLVGELQSHPELEKQNYQTSALVNRLTSPIKAMNLSGSGDTLGSLVSGAASRVSPSDASEGVANILEDVGPACTLNATTFRETLTAVTSFAPNGLDEAAMARIIYFLSDKSIGAEGASFDAASSSLLGSLIPGRSNEGSGGGWNLESVSQVLEQDYSNLGWQKVASLWDFSTFKIKSVEQFKSLIKLYRSGAKSDPPLVSFTSQWRNPGGQLSVLETIMAAGQHVYKIPLDEEEMADAAASTSPKSAPTSTDPHFFASMDVLNRLLFVSDIPALYHHVREIFVKGLFSCPEVLLCALVRLQLNVANANSNGNQNNPRGLVNSGMQIKSELMMDLIPLFFRPNTTHRITNAPAALRRLYSISPNTVTAACFKAWGSTAGDGPQGRLAAIVHIINIARLLPSPAEAVASLLNGTLDPEFSVAIAFVMSDNDYLQLKPWLVEKLSQASTLSFATALVSYLAKNYSTAAPRNTAENVGTPLVSIDNIAISLLVLKTLDRATMSQPFSIDGSQGATSNLGDNIKRITDACVGTFPTLRATVMGISNSSVPNVAENTAGTSSTPSGSSDDVEEMATAYFQKIYTAEQSIGEVVEMLKRFKTSGNSRENEIFACMVHNLFDEYRFYSRYPPKELKITGILFGTLIQEQLVSSITLGIALRYVLEALRKPPAPLGSTTSSGKMFKFGMYALEQFKSRLHEWPQYCSHIVQIPHLRDGYSELVQEIEEAMSENQNRPSTSGASSVADTNSAPVGTVVTRNAMLPAMPDPAPIANLELSASTIPIDVVRRVAEFGPKLGRAVTSYSDEDREFEAPSDSVLDRVQMLLNNLAPSNVEAKSQELRRMLDARFFGWLGHFLVVKRISTQVNFHTLYLSLLDHLGEYGRGLVEASIDSVFHYIGKLLRSPTITASTSERFYLKNLGIWLGQITLARNRPIMQIMLDCKELLLQGYETGKLIAVAPFLAKTLEGAKNSVVFRPPNPWLMGLLGVFRSVYNVDGLKMNIKFEVEVLCKNLNVRLEDIPLQDIELNKRVAPIKEKNPDFNIRSTSTSQNSASAANSHSQAPADGRPSGATANGDSRSTSSENNDSADTVIPNLAAYVTVNPNLAQLLQQSSGGTDSLLSRLTSESLKRSVPIAVDRAIREIISPVVERSVTMAKITTKEIVTKDFAMESDEARMRRAGQLMVANLAGSLALVTCREPLRSSVSTHLRQLLTSSAGGSETLSEQDQSIIEKCVQICATDNLELGCMLIEKAATEKAVRDVDESLATALNARRTHREQTGQPFYDTSIFGPASQLYPRALPEQLRPTPGSLRNEHFQLYESFQRMPRQTLTNGGSGVAQPASHAPVTRSAAGPPDAPNDADPATPTQIAAGSQPGGIEAMSVLASKLDITVTSLLSAAGSRAPEIKLSMLRPDHQINQILAAVKQVMPNIAPTGGRTRDLTQAEQETVLGFSQGIFKRLYELSLTEPLRLEALVALLESINLSCPKLGKDIGTWATYAPTNTESQRRLHRTVLLLLIRSKLLAVNELDTFLAARADNGRNAIWVDFSQVFIRTALMERISTSSDFPKLIELMTRIAEGRSQASAQVIQACRRPILRMLEETRALAAASAAAQPNEESRTTPAAAPPAPGPNVIAKSTTPTPEQQQPTKIPEASLQEISSLSSLSLSNMTQASRKIAEASAEYSRNDPQGARQQVTSLIDSWIRLYTETSGSETSMAPFLQVLHQFGVGKVGVHTERFLRLSTTLVVEASMQGSGNGRSNINYNVIDVYSKLLLFMFRHLNVGGNADQIVVQRLSILNKILSVTIRTMMWSYEKSKQEAGPAARWDQRPWFRILLNLITDVNKPDPAFEPMRLTILSVFGAALHVCQPLAMPSFAFSWFELVSHRHFLPNVLLAKGQKGWSIAHELLIDYFLFLEPHLKRGSMSPAVKKLYEGTLRVLLVLLHDFPSFLVVYHLSFCNVIPEQCVQLRNLILAASPKGMSPPDPFTPNLKIDLLPEIQQSPVILSNVLGPIERIRPHLDGFLKDGQVRNFLSSLPSMLMKDGTKDVDVAKINSLVLYVGIHALARIQNGQISLSRTPEIEVLKKLMEFDDKNRYTCLNAIADQLRYPSSHTHYFSCVMLYLFSESHDVGVKEQVTRVLLERLILHRPHPWGLLITFIELIKNQRYAFWSFPFTRCATEIEKVFESVARSCMPPGSQRPTVTAGGDE